MEEYGFFYKFYGFKYVKMIIYFKILFFLKLVMYKIFLMWKYSLFFNFYVYIFLNKKMYGYVYGLFKLYIYYVDKLMYLKRRKMKKVFKLKLLYFGGYGKYFKGLLYGIRGKILCMFGLVM